jgi:hypothetical protein
MLDIDPVHEEAKGRKTAASLAINKAMTARRVAEESFENSLDAAFESGWELGIIDERSRVADILTALERRLTDSEEDAKLTIEIIRKLISTDSD